MRNKYELIADDIRKKIFSHDYEVGEQLPQEMALAKAYNASRITIRRALDELLNEGLIYKIQGSGTYVREDMPTNRQKVDKYELFDTDHVNIDILNFSVINVPRELQTKLMLNEFDLVYEIERTFTNSQVFAYEHSWLPIKYIQGMNLKILKGSVFEFLNNDLDITPDSAQRMIKSVLSTDNTASVLEMNVDEPLVLVRQQSFLTGNRLFYYSETLVNTERCPLMQNL